jgi:hypothetical protein
LDIVSFSCVVVIVARLGPRYKLSGIDILFQPLQEFEVILKLAFNQTRHRDSIFNAMLVESRLQDFEIGDVFILVLGIELDFGKWDLWVIFKLAFPA